jgi:thiol-disulfide isomerase/thioredoxin
MRVTLFVLGLIISSSGVNAANVRIELDAPGYKGERALLYRYLDLFTLRTELIGQATVDAQGKAVLEGAVTGTVKGTIRIGGNSCDLWLRSGTYTLGFPVPAPGAPRSLNGTTMVAPVFKNMERTDVNALMSDLNQRLDDFIAEDLATDQQAGMQALDIARKDQQPQPADSVKRPGTLFITPSWSTARVDSFEKKLRGFYNEVKDPWFWQNLDYGIAGLRFGPRVNDKDLFDHYLKGKPVLYDVPEYVRFLGSFFEGHLMRFPFRAHEEGLTTWIRAANPDTVKKIFAEHDFLKDDALCELVVMSELYAQYPGKTFDRSGILRILDHLSTASEYPQHRLIAANMRWDLTTMRTGGTLPPLVLRDAEGNQVRMDTSLHDATCLAITAGWCTYCEQEMVALETLYKEYGAYVHVVGISLDKSAKDFDAYTKAHPGRDWPWYYGGDDPTIMDHLRIRTIPAFFLLNGNTLVYAPAPPPSNGMAAIFHRIKAQADEENKLKPDQGPPPPRR